MTTMNCFFSMEINFSFYSPVFLISFFVFITLMPGYSIATTDPNDVQTQRKNMSNFNFVAAGDFGCNENSNKTIAGMIGKFPELVITLGDLSYDKKDASCWLRAISPLDHDDKIKITLGEHDVTDNIRKYYQYVNHFNLSKPYSSFDYNNVHFLLMATAKEKRISYSNDSEQYEFVKQDLSNAQKNKSIDWIIVTSFRSFYSTSTTHPGLDALQDTYHQLFDKYGVDIVLQAHNHNYQRTYPLSYNETVQSTPIIRDKGTEDYANIKKGQIFITVGTGGEKLYNFTGQAPYVIRQLERHGFLNVDVTDNGDRISGTFIDNEEGSVLDHFTIEKKSKRR